ncbi:isocitrate lyase/phosphoenolpyruvate mutase family protein [Streptomyces sp. NBC_01275]|uniref:isocitrate lyase/PEP mutase family protein n=1 Tax=Streptomyces sp. NBC_01275 TaxID=2903807 RepID=UPI002250A4BB|nr:isocitrate lyase/phosphoenolpyruvate mutase family protein [Streptomyces sp. NBC_01275]MCX4765766.1 isocitrate lyase/phosphoenolpyruvate mutase family protein [Streptomyces sp. NBC_01275]
MTAFAALHHAEAPLLLPNAWDHASALALAREGFRAVGTTSLGVAAAVGLSDGSSATRDDTLRLALLLGSRPFLLSVDAEDGFSEDPDEVGEFARQLAAVGAVGINLEDGLGSAARHAEKIAAVKSAAPGLFVNARTDTYWLGRGRGRSSGGGGGGGVGGGVGEGDDTMSRLDAYQQAGADAVFVPGLTEPRRIAELVARLDVPLNVLYAPTGPTVAHLADLGVGRISLGSFLYRRALGAALQAMAEIREGRTPGGRTPTYDDVQGLGDRPPSA